jgi:hypothetical protein
MPISVDRRILAGWVAALTLLWAVLRFGFHVAHPIAWIAMIAVGVGVNGFIAIHLDRDE